MSLFHPIVEKITMNAEGAGSLGWENALEVAEETSLVVMVGYGLSFYLLSLSLKIIPIGTAFALWSGIGIVLTVVVGAVLWNEKMDWARGIGIALILGGILTINLFSKVTVH